MSFKQNISITAILLIILTGSAFSLCPGTYFKTAKTQALATPVFSYWYQDFDGDGKKDLVGLSAFSNIAGPNSIVFYKRSAGGFDTPPVITSLGGNFEARYVTPGDINGDGKKDLLVATATTPSVITVYLNNGSGAFSLSPVTTQAGNQRSLTGNTGDLNGDGRDDIFIQEAQSLAYFLYYRLTQADGTFGPEVPVGGSGGRSALVGDVDGNGLNDIYVFSKPLLNQPGSVGAYFNAGGGTFSGAGGMNSTVPVQALADLNGDLDADGITPLYLLNNNTVFSFFSAMPGHGGGGSINRTDRISHAPGFYTDYSAPQAGRFNDDPSNDVLFFGPRNYLVEENDGFGNFTEKIYGPPVRGIPDDFSGDGKMDLVSPEYAILSNYGNSVEAVSFRENVCTPQGQTKFIDFDRDGQTDIGSWRAADGRWRWRDIDRVDHDFFWGTNGDIPVPQDYDGDGRTDYAVFRPSNGAWYIYRSSDSQVSIMQFGLSGDKPVPSDFDGDGLADIAVYRPSSGNWYVWQSGSSSLFAANFGLNGDIPLPMDYDGDGRSDLAVFRPSNGTWYEFRSADSSYAVVNFGLSGDRPVPADYDADGKADIAVFRSGIWYILRSKDGGFTGLQFGSAGDIAFPTNNTVSGRGTSLTVYRPGNSAIFDYLITSYIYNDIAGNRIISSILPVE